MMALSIAPLPLRTVHRHGETSDFVEALQHIMAYSYKAD
jgi:hypothetical protein